MADTASAPARPQKRPISPAKQAYLITYNAVSALAWLVVLGRTIAIYLGRGPAFVPLGVADWTRWTQSFAAMEVLHAIFGVVRAPIGTTFIQVLSRYVLVWGVVFLFPWLAQSPVYSSMLFAWSLTEVIRYSYFAVTLSGYQPKPLVLLRYNTFFVLYPIGILSECVLIYYAADPLREFGDVFPYISWGILAVYVPGSYILYTHMMRQRRKVMKALRAEEAGAAKTK